MNVHDITYGRVRRIVRILATSEPNPIGTTQIWIAWRFARSFRNDGDRRGEQ
jgi:hypothetical protein